VRFYAYKASRKNGGGFLSRKKSGKNTELGKTLNYNSVFMCDFYAYKASRKNGKAFYRAKNAEKTPD
jgi:hypothetical protein